jgi:MoaA/NifB/PqqE/SkfB family radical SAM enzyme
MGAATVYFTGGEPLLRADMTTLVGRAHEMGLIAVLLSNGTLLTAELAGALDRAGLDVCILSLTGAAPVDARVLAAAARFRNTALSLIFVLTRKNFAASPEILKAARAARAPVLFQPVFIPEGHELEHDLSLKHLTEYDWSFLNGTLQPWAREAGLEGYWNLVQDFYHGRKMKLERCSFADDTFVIDADGAAYPCFHRRDLPCGNVLEDDFSVILRRLADCAAETREGACFGEHCLSLQTSYKGGP